MKHHITLGQTKELIAKAIDIYKSKKALETSALISFLYLSGDKLSTIRKLQRGGVHVSKDYLSIGSGIKSDKEGWAKEYYFSFERNGTTSILTDMILEHIKRIPDRDKLLWPKSRKTYWLAMKQLNQEVFPELFRRSKMVEYVMQGHSPYDFKEHFRLSMNSKPRRQFVFKPQLAE